MADLFVIFLCFTITLALTGVMRRILLKRDLLDRPNERSSHKIPVPRGGGWALLPVLLAGMMVTGFLQHELPRYTWLIAGTILLALVSGLDDRKGVPPALRLCLHLAAGFLGSLCFAPDQTLFGGWLPLWLDRSVMVIGWAWFINLYNFMDGIDGITGVETVAMATGLCLVMTAAGVLNPFTSALTLILTGSCLGFLVYNWHPAKIFLGDIGSVPLGYLTGFGLLFLALAGYPLPALILPLYYLADSGITITKRALRGEKIWQAHRQHFYQRAALGIGRHDQVVAWIIMANSGLIGAAMLSVRYPLAGGLTAMALVAFLLLKMHKSASHQRPKP